MPSHEPPSREGLLRLRRRDEPNLGRLGRVSGFLSGEGGMGLRVSSCGFRVKGFGVLGLGVGVRGAGFMQSVNTDNPEAHHLWMITSKMYRMTSGDVKGLGLRV